MARLSFADNRSNDSLASKMRRTRLMSFLKLTRDCKRQRVRVIDLGGTENFWGNMWDNDFERLDIVLLNITKVAISDRLPIDSVAGDARDLSQFDSKAFDFCFSNSVIEHVGTLADQAKMAAEIARVGNGYFVQTPHRYFLLEPHFHVPFLGSIASGA